MSERELNQSPPASNHSQSTSQKDLGEADDDLPLPPQALRPAAMETLPRPALPSSSGLKAPPRPLAPVASVPLPMAEPISRPAAASMPRPVATARPASAAASAATNADNRRSSPVVLERENFLMFIKILFKILEDAKEPETKSRAQRIVMECRRRSQQGDPNFTPMMEAVEARLRVFVGEAKWRRAHLFLHHYMSNSRNPSRLSSTIRPRPTALCAGK